MTIPAPIATPRVAIYNCGGAGMNIGALFAKHVANSPQLASAVQQYFVDTSTANHHDVNTSANTIVIGEAKGSGKIRGENYEAINETLPEILHKLSPGQFNIIVAGSSGGTGQTVQSVLAHYFLSNDIPVALVTIGSLDSAKEISNLQRAIMSYEGISKATGKPVCVHYRENSSETPRGEVDRRIVCNLTWMCLMFAMLADKIDENDLRNFLNYPRVTDFPPTVVGMDPFPGQLRIDEAETLLAVTTMATSDQSTSITPPPPYQSTGFLTEEQATEFGDLKLLHWTVLGGTFDALMKKTEALLKDAESASSAFRATKFSNDKVKANSNGFVV